MKAKMNLSALNTDYDTDAECRQALEELRWPDGVRCLRCDSDKISRISTRRQYDCDSCRYRFSVTTGTVFHDSHLSLPKWFLAILLMCEAKKGISANQMKWTIGVAHKTAWYLCHRIRQAMADVDTTLLSSDVEVDETDIGGKGKGYKWRDRKAMVLGALERDGGRLILRKGTTHSSAVLKGFVRDTVADDAARIMTDEAHGYHGIQDHNARHETVYDHSGEYVRGDIHTNGIEGAVGLFKRSIVGAFHQISHKHLDRYLDEFEFRDNNRKNPHLFRDTLARLVTRSALPYERLTA